MEIGPIEYAVISVAGPRLHGALSAELDALRNDRSINVVDLVVVTKGADGTMSLQEIRDLDDEARASYGNLAGDLLGLLSVPDVAHLTENIPPGTSAIVVLFEHAWALSWTGAVRHAGGLAFGGGLVTHDALAKALGELEFDGEETQDA